MRIFITATNTDIGKTYTTIKLIESLSQKGYSVGVIKPIETGVESTPLDGTLLLNALHQFNLQSNHIDINDIVPIQFQLPAAPYIANKNRPIDYILIEKKITLQEKQFDIILIEGAGGLYVPLDNDFMMIDLIKKLKIDKTLLITHCELGCINDTILSQNALKTVDNKFLTIFNCKKEKEDSYKITSYPYVKNKMKNIFHLHSDMQEILENIIKK